MAFSPGSCPVRRRQPGFTLIELLICVATIALLVGLMAPALGRAREQGRSTACRANLHGLQLATYVYADTYRVPPPMMNIGAVDALEVPAEAWRCPTDRAMQDWELGSSYEYLAPTYMVDPPGSPFNLRTLQPRLAMRAYERNSLLPLFWDLAPRHDNDRNVVYWDGHAERRNW